MTSEFIKFVQVDESHKPAHVQLKAELGPEHLEALFISNDFSLLGVMQMNTCAQLFYDSKVSEIKYLEKWNYREMATINRSIAWTFETILNYLGNTEIKVHTTSALHFFDWV